MSKQTKDTIINNIISSENNSKILKSPIIKKTKSTTINKSSIKNINDFNAKLIIKTSTELKEKPDPVQKEIFTNQNDNVKIKLKQPTGIYQRLTATGKRKNAIAALQYDYDNKIQDFTINNKKWTEYFPQERHQLKILDPFRVTEIPLIHMKFKVLGGGITAQSEAVRHAISKCLKILHQDDLDFIKKLKQNHFLTRNDKKVERKKPGQRKARAKFNSKKR
jgi:small subunit ribosomal protein S9